MENSNFPNQKNERPTLITIFCILGFISILFTLLSIIMPEIRNQLIQQYGNLFMLNLILSYILGIIGLIGLWKMKRWGVYFYTAMAVLSIIFSIYQDIHFNLGYIFPLIIASVGWINFKKMNSNNMQSPSFTSKTMDKAKKTRTLIIICNFIFGFLFLPSLFISAMSVMIFDAPRSGNVYTTMFFISVASFPLLVILSIPVSWIIYKIKKHNIALAIAFLPLLSIILFVLSLFLLEIMCDGSFVC